MFVFFYHPKKCPLSMCYTSLTAESFGGRILYLSCTVILSTMSCNWLSEFLCVRLQGLKTSQGRMLKLHVFIPPARILPLRSVTGGIIISSFLPPFCPAILPILPTQHSKPHDSLCSPMLTQTLNVFVMSELCLVQALVNKSDLIYSMLCPHSGYCHSKSLSITRDIFPKLDTREVLIFFVSGNNEEMRQIRQSLI